MQQCYYCNQLFDTKERLYDHLEVHTDIERNNEIISRTKKQNVVHNDESKDMTGVQSGSENDDKNNTQSDDKNNTQSDDKNNTLRDDKTDDKNNTQSDNKNNKKSSKID